MWFNVSSLHVCTYLKSAPDSETARFFSPILVSLHCWPKRHETRADCYGITKEKTQGTSNKLRVTATAMQRLID